MRNLPTVKLAVATCANNRSADTADAPFIQACAAAGVEAVRTIWNNPQVDWASYDACLVRTTWDWHKQPGQFREWIRRTARGTLLINAAPLLEWSLDKRYLADLTARGVACVPTQFVAASDHDGIRKVLAEFDCDQWVIKPTLGATAYRTTLINSREALDTWFRENRDFAGELAIQPYYDTITTWGELSLIYIDGSFSHAIKKLPGAGDFRVQRDFGGSVDSIECSDAERDLGDRCMAALPMPALYGRIDMIRDHDGRPMIIECELVEPELFFEHRVESATQLAQACRQWHATQLRE